MILEGGGSQLHAPSAQRYFINSGSPLSSGI